MSPEAKHFLAVTLVTEAQRRVLLDKLDAIAGFLWTGATPDQAVAEVVDLVDTYHGRGSRLSRGELARTPPGAQFAAARPDTLAADVEARLGRRPVNPSASTALVALDALLASDRTTHPPSQGMGVA
jgi:hypothetical protein